MAEVIRTGKKKAYSDRKNGAGREQWEKRKQARNATRGAQEYNKETKTYWRQ